jgi:hypothetical protein
VGKGKKAKAVADRRARDLEYRAQLGLAAGEVIPSQIGTGLPAGGTGLYRGRDRTPAGRKRATSWRGRYTPDVPVTAGQVRQFKCPRCLAKPGDPCRNQTGAAVSAGHAARRKLAQQAEYKRLRAQGHVAPAIPAPQAKNEAVQPTVARRKPAAPERIDPASGRRAVSAFAAVTREYGGRRGLRVDNGGGPTLGRTAAAPLTKRAAKAAEQQARQVPDDVALAVPCQRCRAVAEQQCRDRDGAPAPIHPGRRIGAVTRR